MVKFAGRGDVTGNLTRLLARTRERRRRPAARNLPAPTGRSDGAPTVEPGSVTAYCAVVSFKFGRNSCVTDSCCPLR